MANCCIAISQSVRLSVQKSKPNEHWKKDKFSKLKYKYISMYSANTFTKWLALPTTMPTALIADPKLYTIIKKLNFRTTVDRGSNLQ